MARKGENIYRRKDGRWEGRYVIGRRDDGRTIFGYIYDKTYREVKSRLLPLKAAHAARQSLPCTSFQGTLEDWMQSAATVPRRGKSIHLWQLSTQS